MDKFATLICHPDTPCEAMHNLAASISWERHGLLRVHYRLEGDIASLVIPHAAAPNRTDGLWQHLCLELFLTDGWCEAYREYNFSPSGEWAVYDFADYRQGMTDVGLAAPNISVKVDRDILECDVLTQCGFSTGRIGLSAVIEEKNGMKSYWALAHPAGKPDFHHPACFAAELPAPLQ